MRLVTLPPTNSSNAPFRPNRRSLAAPRLPPPPDDAQPRLIDIFGPIKKTSVTNFRTVAETNFFGVCVATAKPGIVNTSMAQRISQIGSRGKFDHSPLAPTDL